MKAKILLCGVALGALTACGHPTSIIDLEDDKVIVEHSASAGEGDVGRVAQQGCDVHKKQAVLVSSVARGSTGFLLTTPIMHSLYACGGAVRVEIEE